MAVAGAIIIAAARFFGLSGKLGSLLAIGTSICGVSAIVASKGAIRARNSDVSYAIAAILALGAVALFTLPPLGHLIGLTDHEFGLWAGLAVDNTAETTATGYLFSDEAGKIAVLVKSVRNALIGFVVLGFALYWAAQGEADEIAPGFRPRPRSSGTSSRSSCSASSPLSAIVTAGWLSKGQTANLANVSKWAFLLTFAGVGLNTNFRELARTGWRPLVVAVIGLVVVADGVARAGAADLSRVPLGCRRRLRPLASVRRLREFLGVSAGDTHARGEGGGLHRRVGGLEHPGAVGLLLGADDVHHGVDQRQVGERLREVPEVTAGARFDLLGVEVQRAGEGQQSLAQMLCPARPRRSRPAPTPARTSRW